MKTNNCSLKNRRTDNSSSQVTSREPENQNKNDERVKAKNFGAKKKLYTINFCATSTNSHSFIHSFRPFLQRLFKSTSTQKRSRTQHGYCVGVSRRSAAGDCKLRTCPRSLHGGQSGIRTHDPPVERHRLNRCAITSHKLNCFSFCLGPNLSHSLSHRPTQPSTMHKHCKLTSKFVHIKVTYHVSSDLISVTNCRILNAFMKEFSWFSDFCQCPTDIDYSKTET